ncbi:hypothetical protein K1T71_000556 [Dendrolimus kikuchii]|uniref:Uncharacterized protein n=1 Tax=Dendrolimus kikuchii TaxID=765133 RepID=A0ACC1DJJ3_9NEOP|nr:hypothetical protein K1T71_000556 [Dendrolimus kikuchii]
MRDRKESQTDWRRNSLRNEAEKNIIQTQYANSASGSNTFGLLHKCVFPTLWKKAQIIPIHKKGSRSSIDNYRPISILSTIAKLFEKMIYTYIYPIIARNIPDTQHGFYKVTLWYPRGDIRRQGRPKTKWSDDGCVTLGPYWTRVAEDRAQWRELEEAYAKRHAELRDIF